MVMPVRDFTGMRFGRLTVTKFEGTARRGFAGHRVARWNCLCDCGTSVVVWSTSLRAGEKRSCGCLAAETRIANGYAKGKARPGLRDMTPEEQKQFQKKGTTA